MRPAPVLLILAVCPLALFASKCNYVTLVRCFINILDEWAWTLYELKDNVVTITSDQCRHLKELDKCIKDDLGEKHTCSHNEVVEVSNTVSDLLTHRKNSGSFLKSYYLLTYACSPEGQEVLLHHRDCLRQEKIGEMTLSAGTYLTEKFLDEGDDEVCDVVNAKLKEYVHSMKGLCKNDAAQIMCKSLRNMFNGLHADRLAECDLECVVEEDEAPISDAPHPVIANTPEGQQMQPAAAAGLFSSFAALVVAAAVARN